jgi:pyruvate/2-oxoglutarate dehydrogenase complex dihydrolipoamide acyltransferase (E2) component
VDVLVPDLGDFSDVEVIEVLVKPGDVVGKEDSLITLETEKATADIPSPASGRISAVKVKVGGTVSTGDLIAVLEEAAGESASAAGAERPEDDRTVRQPLPTAAAEAAVSAAVETPTPAPRPAVSNAAPPPPPAARVTGTIDEAGFSLAHASPSGR